MTLLLRTSPFGPSLSVMSGGNNSRKDDSKNIRLEAIADFLEDQQQSECSATELGFVWTAGDRLLTFATSSEFLSEALKRPNISAVLLDSSVRSDTSASKGSQRVIRVRDARLNFFRLHNSLRAEMSFSATQVDPTAKIHPTALIDEVGVTVGANTTIEEFVTLKSGTSIGQDCVIRAGSRLGSDALDIKTDEVGNPYMTDHLGGVQVGNNVEIGHNSVVDRSIFRQTATVIGDHTKIGCLSNISHGVQLGAKNRIAAGVKICGSAVVGEDNWIGPGAIISNLLKVGSRNYIALGAHVLADLEDDWKVVGIRVFKDRKLF